MSAVSNVAVELDRNSGRCAKGNPPTYALRDIFGMAAEWFEGVCTDLPAAKRR
jgi:hypothetical protein